MVKYLATVPGVRMDNRAILGAVKTGNVRMAKLLASTGDVDASAKDNHAIVWAAYDGDRAMVRFLATLPNVDAGARHNAAIIRAAANGICRWSSSSRRFPAWTLRRKWARRSSSPERAISRWQRFCTPWTSWRRRAIVTAENLRYEDILGVIGR